MGAMHCALDYPATPHTQSIKSGQHVVLDSREVGVEIELHSF